MNIITQMQAQMAGCSVWLIWAHQVKSCRGEKEPKTRSRCVNTVTENTS